MRREAGYKSSSLLLASFPFFDLLQFPPSSIELFTVGAMPQTINSKKTNQFFDLHWFSAVIGPKMKNGLIGRPIKYTYFKILPIHVVCISRCKPISNLDL